MAAGWVDNWVWVPIIGLAGPWLLLLFPDGRTPSRRWRPVLWLSSLAIAVAATGFALAPGPLSSGESEINRFHNPAGLPGGIGRAVAGVGIAAFFLLLLTAALGVVSLVVRFRRATPDVRQQIKWFAYGASILGVIVIVGSSLWTVLPVARFMVPLALVLAPVSAGVAILRYRLYDIDVVINRTLVFGALAGFVTAVYVAIVVGIGAAVAREPLPTPPRPSWRPRSWRSRSSRCGSARSTWPTASSTGSAQRRTRSSPTLPRAWQRPWRRKTCRSAWRVRSHRGRARR